MKLYLEPKGWPGDIKFAPNGLLIRVRKGRPVLYFKSDGEDMKVPPFVLDMSGKHTTVTGLVTPVVLKVEESS